MYLQTLAPTLPTVSHLHSNLHFHSAGGSTERDRAELMLYLKLLQWAIFRQNFSYDKKELGEA